MFPLWKKVHLKILIKEIDINYIDNFHINNLLSIIMTDTVFFLYKLLK